MERELPFVFLSVRSVSSVVVVGCGLPRCEYCRFKADEILFKIPVTLLPRLSSNEENTEVSGLRACFKVPWGPVFAEKAGGRGATREHPRSGL
jgi:hypothetical protein